MIRLIVFSCCSVYRHSDIIPSCPGRVKFAPPDRQRSPDRWHIPGLYTVARVPGRPGLWLVAITNNSADIYRRYYTRFLYCMQYKILGSPFQALTRGSALLRYSPVRPLSFSSRYPRSGHGLHPSVHPPLLRCPPSRRPG